MATTKIGSRLKALRVERDLSQDEVARMLGIENRQSVAQIEAGARRLSADELVSAVEAFDVPLDYFTNPFVISGEARFSWRRADLPLAALNAFELKAGEWIGAYRELSIQQGVKFSLLLPRLGITADSSFEEASEDGERIARELGLGEVPSRRLAEAIEERLSTLVLNVDAADGISGAACLVRDLGAVLINRKEPEGRRSFDLAHELFHILTWDAMPPERLDGSGHSRAQKRVEQLADNFASALLMPREVLARFAGPEGNIVAWLNQTASELGVSAVALKWRLVTIGRLDRKTASSIADDALRNNGQALVMDRELPARFGKRFIEVIATAIAKGHLSVRRAAKLLDMSIDELAELCDSYKIARPFDL
jgi:Zn-dependent peptidase ImmA (M78 family)/DNA-binding XRE family transcriptional regulator